MAQWRAESLYPIRFTHYQLQDQLVMPLSRTLYIDNYSVPQLNSETELMSRQACCSMCGLIFTNLS